MCFMFYDFCFMLYLTEWEIHHRPKRRRICAGVLLCGLLWATLWSRDWWGAVLLVLVVWGYAWYEWKHAHTHIPISADQWGISIWPLSYERDPLAWYTIETRDGIPEVVHIYTSMWSRVYTLHGSPDERTALLDVLWSYLTLYKTPRMSRAQQVMRRLRV